MVDGDEGPGAPTAVHVTVPHVQTAGWAHVAVSTTPTSFTRQLFPVGGVRREGELLGSQNTSQVHASHPRAAAGREGPHVSQAPDPAGDEAHRGPVVTRRGGRGDCVCCCRLGPSPGTIPDIWKPRSLMTCVCKTSDGASWSPLPFQTLAFPALSTAKAALSRLWGLLTVPCPRTKVELGQLQGNAGSRSGGGTPGPPGYVERSRRAGGGAGGGGGVGFSGRTGGSCRPRWAQP